MGLSEQRLDENGLYMRTGDGRECQITPVMVDEWYNHQYGGTESERRAQTVVRCKHEITVRLTEAQIDTSKVELDFDAATSLITVCEVQS